MPNLHGVRVADLTADPGTRESAHALVGGIIYALAEEAREACDNEHAEPLVHLMSYALDTLDALGC